MLHHVLHDIGSSLEVIFPRQCAVCTRPMRGASLCFRCSPPRSVRDNRSSGRCRSCFGPHPNQKGEELCETCVSFPLPFTELRYLWEYGDLARDLIRAMKYRPNAYLAHQGGAWLAETLPTLFKTPRWDFVVPIPSSPQMLRKRLFHPTHEIARRMVKSRQEKLLTRTLLHSARRAPQATLTHEERLRGLRKLFTVKRPELLHDKRVLVVEDVITTGATIHAAARALLDHGAAQVDVVALAQARVWQRFRGRLFEIFG
jgi:predicted amidophosphoribosyltransferase